MPVWNEDGFTMCQSSAILRMLGMRYGYYSEDAMECWAIDSMVDFAEGLLPKCNGWIFPAVTGGEIDLSKEDAWFANYWDVLIPVVEARLSEHGKKFIAGTDRPTIADFKCFAQVSTSSSLNPATLVPASALARLDQKIKSSAGFNRWFNAMKTECASYLQTRPARAL